MKILLLSWNFAPVIGGLEDLVTQLFRALRRVGQDVHALTAHAPEGVAETGLERAPTPGLGGYLRFALARGWQRCRAERPDAIVCGSVVTAPVAWLLSLRFRVPFAVIIHGSDVLFDRPLVTQGIRFALRRADRIVANSEPTRALAAEIGLDPERTVVVHPGVAVARFDATARAPESFPGRLVLLSVGRLVRRKGVLEFVEHVVPRLVAAEPRVLHLIVGGDATASLAHPERMRDAIAKQIAERGLSEHVELLGELPEAALVDLYRRADLFVLPVLRVPGDVEGFGIAFLEAALGRTASVATRVGGIPDAVVDGETGVLVEPHDPAAMADAILALLADPTRRAELAARGERRARERFDWDHVARRHVAVLDDLVAERSRPTLP